MRIPKKIKIAGKTVNIVKDRVRATKRGVNGTSFYDHNEILLDHPNRSIVSSECIEQTFIHEVIHFINAVLSKGSTECDAEEYVNPLSEMLYQVFEQLEK